VTADEPLPFQLTVPPRPPEATGRVAWLVLGVASFCFCALCAFAGYGLWQFRANRMDPQAGNILEVFAGPVSLMGAVDVRPLTVPQGQRVAVAEGETVMVGKDAPPGVVAFVTLWDGSTLQLNAGTRVVFSLLRATRYSSRKQEVVLEVPSGRLLLGVSQLGRYQQVDLAVRMNGATIHLEPGGTYLLRVGEGAEVAVRTGRAQVVSEPGASPVVVEAGQKVAIRAGRATGVFEARWELLRNGDFAQGGEDCRGIGGWTFRLDQGADGGTVDTVCRRQQQEVNDQPAWAIALERKGGFLDRAKRTRDSCAGILSQSMAEDVSLYQSVHLDFDLRLIYQSLPGGGPLGVEYPFAVRIHYRDAQGAGHEYTYGFYYRSEEGYLTVLDNGEARPAKHDRWQSFSLDLSELRPALLTGVDLLASGHDYHSSVANVSLWAR